MTWVRFLPRLPGTWKAPQGGWAVRALLVPQPGPVWSRDGPTPPHLPETRDGLPPAFWRLTVSPPPSRPSRCGATAPQTGRCAGPSPSQWPAFPASPVSVTSSRQAALTAARVPGVMLGACLIPEVRPPRGGRRTTPMTTRCCQPSRGSAPQGEGPRSPRALSPRMGPPGGPVPVMSWELLPLLLPLLRGGPAAWPSLPLGGPPTPHISLPFLPPGPAAPSLTTFTPSGPSSWRRASSER